MSKRGKKEDSVASELRRTQDQVSALEKKLGETQGLLDHLLLSGPAVIYKSEAKGNHAVTFISPNIKEQLGYEARDYLEDPRFWLDHIHPEDAPKVMADFTKLFELGHNAQVYRVRAKAGMYRWIQDEMKLVRDAHGEPLETVGHWMDITEQKRIEGVLKESEKIYRNLVDNALVGIFKTNLNGKILYVNDAIVRMLGFETPEELMVHPAPFTYKNPSDREALVKQLTQSGRVVSFESAFLTKTGGSKILLLNATLDGDTLSGMAVDITDNKQAEETLVTLQSIGDGVMTADIQGNITAMNIVAEQLTGWAQERAQGKPLAEVFHIVNALTRERCENPVQKVLQEGKISGLANHTMLIAKDGTERIIADTASPIRNKKGDILGVVLIFRDVTELEKAEKTKIEMAQLSSILDSISSLIYIIDPKTYEIIYANKTLQDTFHKPLVGGKCYQELQGFEGPCAFCTNDVLSGNKNAPYTWEYHNPVVDRDYLMVDRLISWPDGRQVRFESALDVTDRKRAEDKLKESEAKYRNMIANLSEGIYVSSLDGIILDHNSEFVKILGFDPGESLIGKQAPDFWFNLEDRKGYVEKFKRDGMIRNYPIIAKKRDGRKIFLEANARLVKDKQNNPTRLEGTIVDFTDRKLAEIALQESEEKYRNLFENTPVGIYRSKLDGSGFLALNKTLAEMFEYSKEEMIDEPSSICWADQDERAEMVKKLKEMGSLSEYEVRVVTKSGAIKNCLASITLYPDKGYLEGSLIDISDRKRVEKQLQESEAKYRTLMQNIPQKIFHKDTNYRWAYANDKMAADLKMTPEMVIGKTDYDLFPQELADKYNADDRRIMGSGATEEFEEKYIQDGEERWVNTIKTPLINDLGKTIGIFGIFWDITERKRAEERLKQSEANFRTLVENIPQKICLKDKNSNWLYINAKFARDLKTSPEAAIGKTDYDFFPKALADKYRADDRRIMESKATENLEEKYLQDGEDRWVNTIKTTILNENGNASGLLVIFWDITERKRAEAELWLKEFVFKSSLTADSIGNNEGILTHVNQSFMKTWGYANAEEVIGKSISDFLADQSKTAEIIDALSKRGAWEGEYVARKKDGSTFIAQSKANVVLGADGKQIALYSSVIDITERKQVEEQFHATFEQAAVGIAHVDLTGRILRINQRYCDIVGYTHEELIMRRFQDLTYPDDINIDVEYHRQLLAGGIHTYSLEKRYIRKDGIPLWVNLTVSLAREEFGAQKYFITVVEDISKRKRTEEELERTLGALKRSNAELEQFAYVASHDLQEPLRMISSYVQLIARRYKGKLDADADDFINYAIDGSNRMKNLIIDLLTFSRVATRGEPFVNTSAAEVLDQTLKNLAMTIEESRAVITSDPLPEVIVDSMQLEQVFQNLIANAIKFRGERPPEIHVGAKQEKDVWVFSVKDNGIGIDPQYFDRLFTIFQRLNPKEQYPGTGIGLAVCKRIVERHGGRIWVESDLGKGATFYFTISIKKAEELKK